MPTLVAHYPPIVVMERYIKEVAPKYHIDSNIAAIVARAEGLNKTGAHLGFVFSDPMRFSYGPFQLRMDGYGNKFDFGKVPTNVNWKKQIDYALNIAEHHGWAGWHGAAEAGISDFCGINNGDCKVISNSPHFVKVPAPKYWHPPHYPLTAGVK